METLKDIDTLKGYAASEDSDTLVGSTLDEDDDDDAAEDSTPKQGLNEDLKDKLYKAIGNFSFPLLTSYSCLDQDISSHFDPK